MPDEPQTLYEGKYVKIRKQGLWEYAERTLGSGVVVVVPVTDDNRVLFIEQFRPPVQRHCIELPAGLAGDAPGAWGEALALAANRELLEETGYEAGNMRFLAECPTTAGLTSEQVSFFLATQLRQVHDGGGVDDEDIKVHSVPLAGVPSWLAEMTARDYLVAALAYAGLYFAQQHCRA